MKTLILASLTGAAVTFFAGLAVIPLLKRLKAGQPILKYVKTHYGKSGTPTMGGLFFILPCAGLYFAFGGALSRTGTVTVTMGVFYALIGFLDDYIKIKYRRNEGLKPYQKIFFQTAVAIVAGLFAYRYGITAVILPFTDKSAEIGLWSVLLTAFIFIAVTNSVNLTDGLDGLAGGVSAVYLVSVLVLTAVQQKYYLSPVNGTESDGLSLFSALTVGGILGFLVFNTPKAKVFMGDTGSLALGGIISAVSVFGGNALYIPIIGVCFVWSSVSVIIQVVYFKRKRKRVFLMSPFHHHLQLKGYSETKIAYLYSLITGIMGAISVISYL